MKVHSMLEMRVEVLERKRISRRT